MMKSFTGSIRQFRAIANLFDAESIEQKKVLLKTISKTKITDGKWLMDYQHLLLFLVAHASDSKFKSAIESEMLRLTNHLKKSISKTKEKYSNSGLPFTATTASLTHDLLFLLNKNKDLSLSLHSTDEENVELNNLLSFTLPDIEKEYTSAGYEMDELLETLGVKKKDQLNFILNELSKLNSVPFIKDFLVDKFNLFVDIEPKTALHSKLFNRIKKDDFYFHSDILKKFDHLALLDTALPAPISLDETQKETLIEVMQTSLWMLERETDPCTFIDKNSLRYFELERGISVAIFGMIPERQLSVESYVGYTLFKNGYPCAYGGAWVYGSRALFGINIFEQFRGGESGFVLMQLLRTYKQVFDLNYFEVEPYQYGLDNPEGIESGAFWFYYRYGFRPLDKTLNKLADAEFQKIKTKKNYRSSKKTLIRFTESNIGWKIEGNPASPIAELRSKITALIAKKYHGNRMEAIKFSIDNLAKKGVRMNGKEDKSETATWNDFALIVETLSITDNAILELIPELVKKKREDLYAYNVLLKRFLNTEKK